jgi:hypothetical protein
VDAPLELWQRALLSRLAEKRARYQACARARLVLVAMLTRAGYPVSLTRVRVWSPAMQGSAYQWAHAFVWGIEDVPPPPWVVESAAAPLAKAMPSPSVEQRRSGS